MAAFVVSLSGLLSRLGAWRQSPQQLARRAALLLVAGLLAWPAAAQKYRTAAGLRSGGGSYGLTIQQVFLPKATLEGLAMSSSRERSVTLLAQRHYGILGPSLNYYFGVGGHYGKQYDELKNGTQFWGFDGVAGIEYKIALLPVVISFDFKPTIEYGLPDLHRFPTAFSIRYVFIKKKKEGIFKVLDRF